MQRSPTWAQQQGGWKPASQHEKKILNSTNHLQPDFCRGFEVEETVLINLILSTKPNFQDIGTKMSKHIHIWFKVLTLL